MTGQSLQFRKEIPDTSIVLTRNSEFECDQHSGGIFPCQ